MSGALPDSVTAAIANSRNAGFNRPDPLQAPILTPTYVNVKYIYIASGHCLPGL